MLTWEHCLPDCANGMSRFRTEIHFTQVDRDSVSPEVKGAEEVFGILDTKGA